jgi:hypothetical protein
MDAELAEFKRMWETCNGLGALFFGEPQPRHLIMTDSSWVDLQGQPAAVCTCEYSYDTIFVAAKLGANSSKRSNGYTISKPFGEIEKSANNGCGFCKYLHENFGIQHESQLGPTAAISIDFTHFTGNWRFLLQFGLTGTILKPGNYDIIYPD